MILMTKTDLSAYNNNWYQPGHPFKRLTWYFVNVLFFKNALFPFSSAKSQLLRLFGAKIGKGVIIKPCVNIKYPWMLSIGDHSWIGENVWIDNLAQISIGKNCCISQGTLLLCGNHNYKKSTFDLIVNPITLDDGAWIGAKCLVTQGVTAKRHSVLAAGSVLSKDMEANSIYRGNPAEKIKDRVISA